MGRESVKLTCGLWANNFRWVASAPEITATRGRAHCIVYNIKKLSSSIVFLVRKRATGNLDGVMCTTPQWIARMLNVYIVFAHHLSPNRIILGWMVAFDI